MKQTLFIDRHTALGAKIVDFAGWQMPIQYPEGIVAEHLTTRRSAGLFDVSHMGRFSLTGKGASAFLRHILTNDCEKLVPGQAHYTILANDAGGAIDDAFLYHLSQGRFLLVVNASNKDKDWSHLQQQLGKFPDVVLEDVSDALAMLALQGPQSEDILQSLVTAGTLPQPARNALSKTAIGKAEVWAARTGYTGEPVCFELFIPAESALMVWDKLIEAGAVPIGLGARDTLRLEAGLPLYGHELGVGKDGREIAIYTIPQAVFAMDFSDPNRRFIGRSALEAQAQVKIFYKTHDYSDTTALPKVVRQLRLLDKGIARDGSPVYYEDRPVGWVSSGTMIPYWEYRQEGTSVELTEAHSQRAVGLCIIEPQVPVGAAIEVEVRGRKLKANVVSKNLENRKGRIAYAAL